MVATDAPAIVKTADAYLIAAAIFRSVLCKIGTAEVIKLAEEHAMNLLQMVKDGEASGTGITAASDHSAADPADARLDEETFVDKGGGEKDWDFYEEERESD